MSSLTASGSLNSAFYIGRVLHQRYQPRRHGFDYPLYMAALDLDELDSLDTQFWWFSTKRWAPLQLQRADYFKGCAELPEDCDGDTDEGDLKQRALKVAQRLGASTNQLDRVVMMAQLRCFGIYFSPVNFFFLYQGDRCRYLLAEVSNTPWNQRHCYLVNVDKPEPNKKDFHVSPFMDLNMEYRWKIRSPGHSTFVGIENWADERLFKAVFTAKRYEINPQNARKVLMQWPMVTLSIVRKIYWQAAQLFLKGIQYVPYQHKAGQQNQVRREQ